MNKPTRKLCVVSAVLAVALVLSGCGSESETGVRVDGAWARTSPAMATAGAAYMDITAADGDELVGAAVAASIAARTEVHETVMVDGATEEGMGEMMMQEVSAVSLPAGETLSLEPGGYHIMMLDLAEPLEAGATFDITLTFADAGEQIVTVEVRDDAP